MNWWDRFSWWAIFFHLFRFWLSKIDGELYQLLYLLVQKKELIFSLCLQSVVLLRSESKIELQKIQSFLHFLESESSID